MLFQVDGPTTERHDIASLKCGFTSRRRTKMSKKEWTEEV